MGGVYYHHGVYVSDAEVIHFRGDDDDSVSDWSKAHVVKTSLARFLSGGTVEVKEYNDAEVLDLYPVEGIVNYARSCLGDGGYNLIFNNCEHFANTCTLGRFRSRQVENVLGRNMGIFGKIGSFIGGLFGGSSSSRSSSSYNYEPDKVKVAEIERDTKLKLADKEKERIELMRDAQLDFIKAQAMSQMAIDEARVKGMSVMADQLVVLQEKMLDVAKKRIAIIEEGSMPIIREIEDFYSEVEQKIESSSEEYNTKKLPQLLDMLGKYEQGTPPYEIYMAQINDDRARQNQFVIQQMDQVRERQNLVLNSFLATKEKIIEQTGQITQRVAEGYLKRQIEGYSLSSKNFNGLLPESIGKNFWRLVNYYWQRITTMMQIRSWEMKQMQLQEIDRRGDCKEELKYIGLRIAYFRKLRDFKQAELADKVNINKNYLSQIESGSANKVMSLPLLIDISKALDVELSVLVDLNDFSKTKSEIRQQFEEMKVMFNEMKQFNAELGRVE